MRFPLAFMMVLICSEALAETVVPVTNLRADTVIAASDLRLLEQSVSGAFSSIQDLVGQETKVTLYAGRPVFPRDVGSPAIIRPNEIITLIYEKSPLRIEVDGRALGRGGAGDRLRVMNLSSRSTLFGVVQQNGTVLIEN